MHLSWCLTAHRVFSYNFVNNAPYGYVKWKIGKLAHGLQNSSGRQNIPVVNDESVDEAGLGPLWTRTFSRMWLESLNARGINKMLAEGWPAEWVDIHRCLQIMGMWNTCHIQVVPIISESMLGGPEHCSQGASPYNHCMCGLGLPLFMYRSCT